MIEIKNLSINVEEKEILKDITLNFEEGKNYLILGRNGSGKSSLANFLMGNNIFTKKSGKVILDGINIDELEVNERSKKGIFLSFQNIPEITGIKLSQYLRTIYNNNIKNNTEFLKSGLKELSPFLFQKFIKNYIKELDIKEEFLDRDLNVGFSGGEKRKIELLQAKLLNSKYIILDEIDSGLDIDAFKVVAESIKKINSSKNSIIVITHLFKINEYINFDKVYVLKDGKLDKEGNIEILKNISESGFQ